jgi:hypothetical protein
MFEVACMSECDEKLDINEIKTQVGKLADKFQELDF